MFTDIIKVKFQLLSFHFIVNLIHLPHGLDEYDLHNFKKWNSCGSKFKE